MEFLAELRVRICRDESVRGVSIVTEVEADDHCFSSLDPLYGSSDSSSALHSLLNRLTLVVPVSDTFITVSTNKGEMVPLFLPV